MWQVIGAGAIGSFISAKLALSGEKVQLVTRAAAGNLIDYRDLNLQQFSCSVSTSTRPIELDCPTLLCVKAFNIAAIVKKNVSVLERSSAIILLHNGLGCAEEVEKLLPGKPIICAVTTNACISNHPMHSQLLGAGETCLGPYNKPAINFAHLAQELNKAIGNTIWEKGIKRRQWLKLAINLVINPLTAIYNVKNGELLAPYFQEQVKMIVDEIIVLFRIELIDISKSSLNALINDVIVSSRLNCSSMYQDVANKRKTENDFLSGYILQQAALHNLSMPKIETLYHRIKRIEQDY